MTDIEPWAHTDPQLAEVLKELSAREPIFHRPEFGTSRKDFEQMTAPEFWEVALPADATPGNVSWTN